MFKQILASIAVADGDRQSCRFPAISIHVRAGKTNRSDGEQGCRVVESKGKAAFSEFRKRNSEWWFGNTYLFAYDQNLNVLLNPAFPKREALILMARRMPTARRFMMSF